MDWTDDTIGRLRTLWAEGHSTEEIGRRMGVSKNAIIGKAHRLNLPSRPSPIRKRLVATDKRRASGGRVVPLTTLPPLPSTQEPPRRTYVQGNRLPPVRIVEPPPMPPVRLEPRPVGASCCWPIGDPRMPGFRFCDAAIQNGTYCDEHRAIAYVKPYAQQREDAA